ncbi:MAG: hypothetical protein RLZZ602_1125 [Pseudomonadota bacterium]
MTQHVALETPVGTMRIESSETGISAVLWPQQAPSGPEEMTPSPLLAEAAAQLRAYFSGQLKVFDLPLQPEGTEFQQRVWQELKKIPWGATTTYGEIARALSSPKSARAVGAAIGRNPLSIVVPCHRVIGRDGSLTGFAGGLERKSWLLNLEQEHTP